MLFKGVSWVDIVASCGGSLISLDVNRGFILSKNATICFRTDREINVSCIGKDSVLGWIPSVITLQHQIVVMKAKCAVGEYC